MPPPVLVSAATTIDALAIRGARLRPRRSSRSSGPGRSPLVCHQQTSLQWDLGDTRGTVAVRMPDHDLAREILDRTGPLAVSSANLTGSPAATDAAEAVRDARRRASPSSSTAARPPGGVASTIVDVTGEQGRVLRRGALLAASELNAALEPTPASTLVDEG